MLYQAIVGWYGLYNNEMIIKPGKITKDDVYYSYSYIIDGFRQLGFHIAIILFKKNEDMMAAFSKLDGIA